MSRWILIGMGLVLVASCPAWAQYAFCDDIQGEWVEAEQEVVFHHEWLDNCAVDQVVYEVEVVGQTIFVTELVSSELLAMCECPYSTDTRVGGLAPGDYDVVWHYFFECTGEVELEYDAICDTFTVTVPENAPVGAPGLVGFAVAGCGIDVTAVPDPEPTLPSWADIKELFR